MPFPVLSASFTHYDVDRNPVSLDLVILTVILNIVKEKSYLICIFTFNVSKYWKE